MEMQEFHIDNPPQALIVLTMNEDLKEAGL